MIKVEGLSKRYARNLAVDNISFEVEKGEIVGFLGPNGAGKTTTMRILTCFLPPTSGKASVAGFDTLEQPMEVKKRIGYLPESPPVYPEMEIHEYLTFVGKLKGMASNTLAKRVDEVMGRCAIADVRNKVIGKLSKGYRQRVGLAQAILHDPQLVILDEPMSGLDPVGRREVRDIILELKGAGKTILFSTHILSDAEMLCDRVGVIVSGKLQGVGAPSELVGVGTHKMEILFSLAGTQNTVRLLARASRTGDRYRLEIPEAELYPALDQLRDAGAKILSVAQVKPSLEEYFMHLVSADRAQASAVEVSGK